MWKKFKKTVEDRAAVLFIAVPFGAYAIWLIRVFTNNNSTIMNLVYGFLSTLLGALIGGFCSLAAAVYAGDQQVKITTRYDAQTKMRDTYYVPIYLEILKIENMLSNELGQENEILCMEWERIRGAADVLNIPAQLSAPLEEMRDAYAQYVKTQGKDEKKFYLQSVQKAKSAVGNVIKRI